MKQKYDLLFLRLNVLNETIHFVGECREQERPAQYHRQKLVLDICNGRFRVAADCVSQYVLGTFPLAGCWIHASSFSLHEGNASVFRKTKSTKSRKQRHPL